MTIVASGVRYEALTGAVQAVVVITDANGGKASDLNAHATQALSMGHAWHPVPAAIYSNFIKPQDLADYLNQNVIGGVLA